MGHLFSKSEFYFVPQLVVTVGLVTAFFSSSGDYSLSPTLSQDFAKKSKCSKISCSRKFLRGEGNHIYLSILKKNIYFERRPRPMVMPKHQTLTKDDYKVCLSAEVLCHKSKKKLPFSTKKINQNKPMKNNNKIKVGDKKAQQEKQKILKHSQNGIESERQMKNSVLPSIYTETVEDAVAEFTAQDCVQKKDEYVIFYISPIRNSIPSPLSYKLKETMQDKAVHFDLIVDDVKITDMHFLPQTSENEKKSTPEVPIIPCEKQKKKKDDSPLEITQISDLQEKYFQISEEKNVCGGRQKKEEVADEKQIEVKEVLVMATCKKNNKAENCSGKSEKSKEDITAEVVDVDGSDWIQLHL